MATRSRLPRINFNLNPFKNEKQQLIDQLHAAANAGNALQVDATITELKVKGYL